MMLCFHPVERRDFLSRDPEFHFETTGSFIQKIFTFSNPGEECRWRRSF
jgi:hypothetical protein